MIRFSVRAIVAALCSGVLVTAALAAQQRDTRMATPSGGAPPAPVGTAAVRGSVVADATGAPVAYASVVLIGARTGVLKVASTRSPPASCRISVPWLARAARPGPARRLSSAMARPWTP
jgi:hypothetical protein